MMDVNEYIRRETIISIAINTALSLLFFLLVFGWAASVPVWGMGNYVFDFLPQAFMIAFMSNLVPGLLAQKKMREGKVATIGERSLLPSALPLRAGLIAFAAASASGAAFAGIFYISSFETLGWSAALAVKLAFGAGLAAFVTPIGLRATLSAPRRDYRQEESK